VVGLPRLRRIGPAPGPSRSWPAGTGPVSRVHGTVARWLRLVVTPLSIPRRILHHPEVTGETIPGAICVYVVIGIFFGVLSFGISKILPPSTGSRFRPTTGSWPSPDHGDRT
jgi:hypothetical protein